MRTFSPFRGAPTVLTAAIGLGLLTPFLALNVSCTASDKDKKVYKPNISTFLVSKANPIPATAPEALTISTGDSAYLAVNFANTGGSAILTPGNIPMVSGVPIKVGPLTVTTPYTLTVSNSAGETVTKTTTITVVPFPDATITAPAAVISGVAGQIASVVAGAAGTTYLWQATNATITAGGSTNSATFTPGSAGAAGSAGTMTLTCTVTNPAKALTSATKSVSVLARPPQSLTYTVASPTYYNGVPIPANVPNSLGGDPIQAYAIAPAPPAGLAFNTLTGVLSGTPTAITPQATYVVTASNTGGAATTNLVIKVDPAPAVVFNATRPTVGVNQTTTLGWTIDSSVTSISISDGTSVIHTATTSGTKIVTLGTTSKTFTLTAQPSGFVTTVTITVDPTSFAIAGITANPTQVAFGETTTLGWTLTGYPDHLTLDGLDVMSNSSVPVTPVRRQTFTLSGGNLGASDSKQITVASRGLDVVAGAPVSGGFKDGTGSNARFWFDTGALSGFTTPSMNLTLDPSGNLYVADSLNHVVRMVTPAGVTTTLAGKPGVPFSPATATADGLDPAGSGNGAAARFNRPAKVLYINDSKLYVLSYNDHTLRLMTKQADGTWTVSLAAGTPGAYGAAGTQKLDNPLDMVYSGGKVLIADGYTGTIRAYDPAAAAGTEITTFSGAGGYGFLDGAATVAKMNTNSGMVLDPATGDIFVADRTNHAIRKVTATGAITTIAGAFPTATLGYADGVGTAARFSRPCAITRDASGNLYVADNGNHAIRMLTPTTTGGATTYTVSTIAGAAIATATPGTYTAEAGFVEGAGNASRFNGPQGIVADAAGNLYVADTLNYHVRKLTPSGSPATFSTAPYAGSRIAGLVNTPGLSARFMAPNGVAADKNGTVYVADEGNKVIRKIATDGTVSTWGTGVTYTDPYSVAVDNALNVYVLDRVSTTVLTVVKIDAAGTASALTLTGAAPVLTNASRGMAVTKDGTALFLANGNNLQKFNLATGAQSGAITTGLTGVNGIATAADGVYWVEFATQTVKKAGLDLTGVTTLAGIATSKGYIDGAALTTRFNGPVALALAVDPVTGNAKKVFVADQSNHAVRALDLSTNEVTTVVGLLDPTVTNGIAGRFATVPGTLAGTAGLWYPKAITINPAGDLIVTSSDGVLQITAP